MKLDLAELSVTEILKLYSEVMYQLAAKNITSSSNNPVADYTENLVCEALSLDRYQQSTAGYDAIDPATSLKYQIKGRRITPSNKSTQLSSIRNLDKRPFDILVAVVFKSNFKIDYAIKFQWESLKGITYVKHTNSWKLMANKSWLGKSGVEDITKALEKTESSWGSRKHLYLRSEENKSKPRGIR
jgi:hypothetical protein